MQRRRVLQGAIMCAWIGLGIEFAVAQNLPFNFVDVTSPTHPQHPGIFGSYNALFGLFTENNGGAVADYNNDGLLDVFFPINKNLPNRLFRNNGGGLFSEVAVSAGVNDPNTASAAGLFIDYDNDGDRDLITFSHAGWSITTYGPSLVKVFRNRGAANGYTFANVTSQCGLHLMDPATVKPTTAGMLGGACAGDIDRDGDLDLMVCYWQGTNNADMWRLWRNDPNPVPGSFTDPNYSPRFFTDITIQAGLNFDITPGEAWQPTFVDINRDGWLDLHVDVDFGYDYMFLNDKTGKFTTEVAMTTGLNGNPPELRNEMGCAWGDIDNDGDLDLHLTNQFYQDRFYRNDSVGGNLAFVDVAPLTGLHNSSWGWGTVFFDVDNDGDLDHSSVSGFKYPTAFPFWNTMHINQFPQKLSDGVTVAWTDATSQLVEYSGTNDPAGQGYSSRGFVVFDLDNDGDLDALHMRRGFPYATFLNTLNNGADWIEIDLKQRGGSLNIENSKVWLRANGVTQQRLVLSGSSLMNQEPPRQHFGLGIGGGAGLKWVVVRWFGGRCQIVKVANLNVNHVNTIPASNVDDTGDLDGDGHLTFVDRAMLQTAISNFAQFQSQYPDSPGLITGDIDDNGIFDNEDMRLWKELPIH